MPIDTEVHERRCKARASGDMTIYVAAEMKQRLADVLAGADEIELDLAEVQEFDSAGVQLLLWFGREAVRGNKRLRIAAPSRAVNDALTIYHLGALVGEPGDRA